MPKVLDFGVARFTDPDSQAITLQTHAGQILGTLAYMSPEQMEGDPLAIDTRSDVYALGVILYEMLTGRLPHDTTGKPLPEAIRMIRETDAPRASSANRALRGDLDTIIQKALEKRVSQRYASAAALAEDIRRSMRDEPILARPPTLRYQFAKFARRNRALVTGAVLALLALVLGVAGTSWQAIRATREQKRAVQALAQAEGAKRAMESALADAQTERATAEAINAFLNRLLAAGDLDKAAGERDLSVADVLERAEKKIEAGEFGENPAVAAGVRRTLAQMNRQMGRLENAEKHARLALELQRKVDGDTAVKALASEIDLGEILVGQQRWNDADAILRATLPRAEAQLGLDHVVTATAAANLAQAAAGKRDFAEAERLNRQALAYFERSGPEYAYQCAILLNNLGNYRRDAGDVLAAEPFYRKAIDAMRGSLGEEHYRVATMLNNLALCLKLQKRLEEAEPLYRQALALRRKLLPEGHIDLAESLNNLGSLYRDRGDWNSALPLFHEALTIVEKKLPAGHSNRTFVRRNVGTGYWKTGRYEDAEPFLEQSYREFAATGPAGNEQAGRSAQLLAQFYEDWGKSVGSAALAEKAAKWRARQAELQPASASAPAGGR